MFNGIIAKCGIVKNILGNEKGLFLKISSDLKFAKKDIGSSVSCSGVCLTLENFNKNISFYYLSKETLNKSNFKTAKKGNIINIEKSIRFGSRISGHFVQGHVDTISKVKKIYIVGKSWFINFELPTKYRKLIVEKGSIAINGVSLSISKILKNGFETVVIPKTLKLTNLFRLKEKDLVNVEFDVLGKYINSSLKNL